MAGVRGRCGLPVMATAAAVATRPWPAALHLQRLVPAPLCNVCSWRSRGAAAPRAIASAATAPTAAAVAAGRVLGLTRATEPVVPEIGFVAVPGGAANALAARGDLLLVLVTEEDVADGAQWGPELAELDAALGGALAELAAEEEFKGKPGQSTIVRLQGAPFARAGLAGLGKAAGLAAPGPWRGVGVALAAAAKQAQAAAATVIVPDGSSGGMSTESRVAAASSLAAGAVLGSYEDTRFKKESKKVSLKQVAISGLGPALELEPELGRAMRLCAGIILAKQLVNAPANVLTPQALADVAEGIRAAHADVMQLTLLDEAACAELGMGAYLGVAAASTNPPRFIHLKYTAPSGPVDKKLAVVGKGLTFDSGGYNLKTGPGSMIELMKFDMGGAAATLGAAKALGAIQPPGVEVNFIVAACENMIDGAGMRPGDILTASNGKTIEVNNTDAEGRLTLADALVYACSLKVDAIVDLATLTGACIIALGNDIGGLFTPHESLAEELRQACAAAGEKLWRMPMEESYFEGMKSQVADMLNTGGRAGGSITASLFLKEFVDAEVPWAHLDIAGPVWNEKKGGATGFAVATLVKWVLARAEAAAAPATSLAVEEKLTT
eukprot:SM000101S09250  [mRNA]  locus=s101:164179:167129:- [translate_table: standard]